MMTRHNHSLQGAVHLSPDYFVAKLFHDLMGTSVLDLRPILLFPGLLMPDGPPLVGSEHIRTYSGFFLSPFSWPNKL